MLLFKDCTLEQLDDTFHLTPLPLKDMPVLQDWLQKDYALSDQECGYAVLLQHYLQEHVEDWNEQELAMHFIGPIFALIQFDYARKFNLFAERPLHGVVDGIELSGTPDGMIATGYRHPEKPYFCFQGNYSAMKTFS